ncbi:hypothetical protein DN068_06770 [Taibaiella soli]|uniref:Uncharacterized protein n=2 Tax=Taibaiella soli TaxID=1649169 RepID=A0A2W2B0B0_9BACT|nr:hypothetical protein DN068_06770 [Taibaiella soli]
MALIAAGSQCVMAQDVKETTVSFMKADHAAFSGSYNYPKSMVEKVLADRLAATGLDHGKSTSGFKRYSETIWTGITDTKGDIYTKVSGSKKNAVVYVLISKGYDNFISSTTDSGTAAKTKDFLVGLEKDISAYQQQLILEERQKELAKQEKKEQDLQKKLDKQSLELQKAQSALDATKSKS